MRVSRLICLFALASFVETLGFGHLGAFTPLYLRQLGVEPAVIPQWTGILSAASLVLGLPLAPLWGVWADRYSQKLIIVRSTLGEGVIFFLFSSAGSVWHLLIARALVGFILGNTGVMYAALANRTPRHQVAMAIGFVGAGSTLGMSVGPFVGGWLATWIGLERLYLLDALLCWCVALLLIVGLDESRRVRSDGASTWALLRALPGNLVASPAIPWLFGLYFLVLLGAQMQGPFVPLLVETVYAGSDLPVAIGLVLLVAGLLSAVSGPTLGRLAALWGDWRVLGASLGVSAVAAAAQLAISSYRELLAVRAAFDALQGGAGPVIVSLIAAATPEAHRSSVLNMILFPAYFAWLIGGLVGAGVAGVGVRWIFGLAAVVLALSAMAVPVVARGSAERSAA